MIASLSTIIWLPVVAGAITLALGKTNLSRPALRLSQALSFLTLILTMYLLFSFDQTIQGLQFTENFAWMPSLKLNYSLGVDGFAVLLLALTAIMSALVLVSTKDSLLASSFLILQGLMSGVFAATDALLFFVFFEAMMLPLFLIIGLWGGARRKYATIKFLLYTLVGSVAILISLLYLSVQINSFNIAELQSLKLSFAEQQWLFFALFIGFAVKVPTLPFHSWLPDAHTEAPTGASVLLAAITLKVGAYGMLRFTLPVAIDACQYYANLIIGLSILAIIYIGTLAIAESSLKRLIAYSSIAHMGFVTLGLFLALKLLPDSANAAMSLNGAFFQMLSHGVISGAMFFAVGSLYQRMHTLDIKDYGGVVHSMPVFASFFMLFSLANLGLPATAGFVGEFLVIIGSAKLSMWVAFGAAMTLILSAVYTLWMYRRVVFGKAVSREVAALVDLDKLEIGVFIALAALIMFLGLYPNFILRFTESSIAQLFSILCVNSC